MRLGRSRVVPVAGGILLSGWVLGACVHDYGWRPAAEDGKAAKCFGGDCVSDRPFFPDADGDGWGEPGSEATMLPQADQAAGLTATNRRDCDDSDPAVTGKIGPACPGDLVEGTVSVTGVRFGASEYVVVYGAETAVVRHVAAETACRAWGGSRELDGVSLEGHLATLAEVQELNAVQDELRASSVGVGEFAGFVGIVWQGATALADPQASWVWSDGSTAAVDADTPWCFGEPPSPFDYYDHFLPAVQAHVDGLQSQLPDLRLALVWDAAAAPSGEWCLGLPDDAAPAQYSAPEGHFICERPAPDPEAYAVTALPEDEI